ncbi:SH3 domain-containing protein [Streptomyces sp. NPDC056672]|uniref:SH3 domain-containing protein n=1 Tax=Streptomyces sp. NPDC056672 TaxID=3345906 RepID=UPI0036A403C7
MHTTSKRRAAATLTLALTSGGAVTASSAQAIDNRCYITASAANVRSQPTVNSTAVGVAYKGWACDALDTTPYSTWAKVRIKKTRVVGWVRHDLVHTPGEGTQICLPGTCPGS